MCVGAKETMTIHERAKKSEFGSAIELHTSFWQMEINRYTPNKWMPVKIAVLVAYFQICTQFGGYLWPRVVATAESYGLDTEEKIKALALPLSTMFAFAFFTIYGYGFFGIVNAYFDDTEFFKAYRIHKGDWSWATNPEYKGSTSAVYWDMFKALCFNLSLYIPQFPLVKYILGTPCPFRVGADDCPGIGELVGQVAFSVIMFDVTFHHIHRAFHSKALYWLHRTHHTHPVTAGPVGAMYHPADELLEAVTASLAGPILLYNRMHIVSFTAWFIFAIWAALEIHCGYELPWNMYQILPFSVDARYHDFHHRFHHRGNYSAVFTIWDYIYGTNKDYYEWVRNGGPFDEFVEPPHETDEKKKLS